VVIEFQAGRRRNARMVVLGVAIVILIIVSMMKQGMTGSELFFLTTAPRSIPRSKPGSAEQCCVRGCICANRRLRKCEVEDRAMGVRSVTVALVVVVASVRPSYRMRLGPYWPSETESL